MKFLVPVCGVSIYSSIAAASPSNESLLVCSPTEDRRLLSTTSKTIGTLSSDALEHLKGKEEDEKFNRIFYSADLMEQSVNGTLTILGVLTHSNSWDATCALWDLPQESILLKKKSFGGCVSSFLESILFPKKGNKKNEDLGIEGKKKEYFVVSDVASLASHALVNSEPQILKDVRINMFKSQETPSCDFAPISWLAKGVTCESNLLSISAHLEKKYSLESDSCQAILVAEGNALQQLTEDIKSGSSSSLISHYKKNGDSVLIVAPTMSLACFRTENDIEGEMAALSLLGSSIKTLSNILRSEVLSLNSVNVESLMILLPSDKHMDKNYKEFAHELLKHSSAVKGRKLQALVDHEEEPLRGPGAHEKEKEKKVLGDTKTSEYDYLEDERRQILIWVPIVTAAVLGLGVYALLYMPIEKDPLLYTKISTAPTHAA